MEELYAMSYHLRNQTKLNANPYNESAFNVSMDLIVALMRPYMTMYELATSREDDLVLAIATINLTNATL